MKRGSDELREALALLERQCLKRVRRTVERLYEPGNRAIVVIDGCPVVDFSNNDYLGLAAHPALAAAMGECARSRGAGSGASHLVTGHGGEHAALEEELAEFLGRERAVLFSTGYMANLAILTVLGHGGERVLLDRLSHASLIDAALLSGARLQRYAHADPNSAATALARSPQSTTVLATDGIFSMDGDVAPLDALSVLTRRHCVWLVVDDAHGIGVLGANGRGSVEHFGLNEEAVPVLMGTLGKAFGVFGAFVAGPADLIELLIQKGRSYVYTTALPQPVAAAARRALAIARKESWRRERVLALTARFRAAAAQAGIRLACATDSESALGAQPITPIQPVILGDPGAALSAQEQLLKAGFCVIAMRPPTVPTGTARLRITFSSAHTEAQVDGLIEALSRIRLPEMRVCP